MKLVEFFNKPLDINKDNKSKAPNLDNLDDELFWFIIDHDKIHKDYFFPIAKKLKTLKECGPEMVLELYMPMVKKGCKEYYQKENMQGKLGKVFPAKFREAMCHRIHDHYFDDVQSNKYNIG